MINIKILVALSKELSNYEEDIELLFDENCLLEFITLDNLDLEGKLLNSDIQIIVIEKNIKNFTEELYRKIKKQDLFLYFNTGIKNKEDRGKYKINELSPIEFKELKQLYRLKKIYQYKEVSTFTFLKELENDLEGKVDELRAKKEAEEKPQIDSTYLEAIKIKDYFSIKDMEIEDLKGKREIYFVGENGDGKTVLLQAIALALKGDKYSIFAEDYIKDIKDREEDPMDLSTKDSKYPNEYRNYKNVKNLFAYGISRNKYDSETSEEDGYSGIFETPLISIKLRKPQDLLRIESALIDNEFIPKIQDLMSDKFKIIKEEGEVYFQEINAKTIPFKMLSEGYKSTLIWLCDLLSRLIENQPEIIELEKFQAIVLIDEVDLYLHPKWKYDFMYKLRKIFSNIQFIMTTHSLVTILGASASEETVFYKVYKEDGETKITEPITNISEYTANILTTSPLFEMKSAKARAFDENNLLSSDDYQAHELNKSIDAMLSSPDDETIKDDILKQLEQYNERT